MLARSFLFLLISPLMVVAADPNIRTISVRGLQIGSNTTITIDGDDLTASPKLLLPFTFKQELQPKSTDKTATFSVSVPEAVTPGLYQLRVVSAQGVSLPIVIGVDRLPQQPLLPTTTVEKLPVALHGIVANSTVIETKFVGTAKQKITIDIEAQRIGSKLRPIIHLYGSDRKQLGWSWGKPTQGGDCRLEAVLPSDGTYSVTVHDAEYASPTPGFFRLKIGEFATSDQVFPPVIAKDQKSVELLTSTGVKTISFTPDVNAKMMRIDWPKDGTWTGPQPFATVSNRAEIVETQPSTTPRKLPEGPIGVSGKLTTPNAEAQYLLPTVPGSKLKFDVMAERLGSPIDVSLVICNEAGVELARADDGTNTLDPTLEYTIPDKVTAIVVAIVDAQGRGSPRGIYRFTVDPAKPTPPPDVKLITPTGRITLLGTGGVPVPIHVERTNYNGSVQISAKGLSPGVQLENATIPTGSDGTLVLLKAGGAIGETSISAWAGTTEFGSRPVSVRNHPLERLQPWLAQECTTIVVPATPGMTMEWKVSPVSFTVMPTRKLTLPVKVTRPDPNTTVKLTLITSQLVPILNNQPDATKAIRLEKPVEIPVKASDGELSVLVPVDLNSESYDIAVQAEIVAADKKTIVATVYTPIQRIRVTMPVTFKFAQTEINATLDPKLGYVAEIQGTVERAKDITGDVTLVATGLPAGARLETPVVKITGDKISTRIIFPAATLPGKIGDIKWTATIIPDAKTPAVVVKSREVTTSVNIPARK